MSQLDIHPIASSLSQVVQGHSFRTLKPGIRGLKHNLLCPAYTIVMLNYDFIIIMTLLNYDLIKLLKSRN